MREALIVLPRTDNAGGCLLALRQQATRELAQQFGGCTVRDAFGHWVAPCGELVSEPVWELTVACEPSATNTKALRMVALWLGSKGRQEAMYLRGPDGTVEIIPVNQQASQAA